MNGYRHWREIVLQSDADRQTFRACAGGMGPLLGDAGNGYSIGHAALAAVTRAEDGRSAVPCHILKVTSQMFSCTQANWAPMQPFRLLNLYVLI